MWCCCLVGCLVVRLFCWSVVVVWLLVFVYCCVVAVSSVFVLVNVVCAFVVVVC